MIYFLVALLINYKYSMSQHYDKCISENTKSSFCEAKISEVKKSQLVLAKSELESKE